MKHRNTIVAPLALILTLAGAGAARAEVLWSTIGGAASVDEASQNVYDARRAGVFVRSDAAMPAVVTLRYAILPSESLRRAPASLTAQMFDNDSGSDAVVSIELREVALEGPAPTAPLLSLSSDGMAASAGIQRGETRCSEAVSFDFEHNAYFLLVTLTRRSASAQPGIYTIQLDSCD